MATREVRADLTLAGGAKVTGLPTPTASSDAASKAYVDAATVPGKILAALTLR